MSDTCLQGKNNGPGLAGCTWSGVGGNWQEGKREREWEQFLREKSKSWKGGAQSGECARSRWERLLESGWARTEVRGETQAQGSEKEAWQSGSGSVDPGRKRLEGE